MQVQRITRVMMVSVEDDRVEHPDSRGRMATALSDFQGATDTTGLAAASADALTRARDPRPPAELDVEFFEFTIARALNGMSSWLDARQP